MKHRTLSIRFLLLLAVIGLHAESAFPQVKAQGIPVLEVNFAGKELSDAYSEGNMRLSNTDGTFVELNAKFKSRGATALKYTMKPSFNMKLQDENREELDSTLCGLRSMSSWILDAMAIDRIDMRNRVAFDLWNDLSRLPYSTDFDSRNGTVGQFLEVYINGTYKGIYCLTDRINRKLLNLKKPSVDENGVTIRGVLYKHGTNSIGDQNHVAFSEDSTAYVIAYHDAWELTEPEDYAGKAAWAPLDTIYKYKNDYEWVKEHFYLQQLAEYQIFIMALSIADNWGNKNSYISARNVTADGDKHRFVYTPWDLDTSLGGSYEGKYYDGNYSDWKPSQIVSASTIPVPISTCNRQNEYKNLLRETWVRARTEALSLWNVRSKMYKYRDLFLQSGAWERQKQYWETQRYKPCYVDDLAKEVDLILSWYEDRLLQMDEYFGINDPDIIAGTAEKELAEDNAFYNLMGQRISQPPHNGIYIHKGRKLLAQ